MGNQAVVGIARLINATKYSIQGFRAAFKNEAAFRQEVILSIILIPLGLYLGEGGTEKAMLVSSILFMLIVELLNTGIEFVVDRISDEQHEYSGIAKDVASSAVLLSLLNIFLVWGLVLVF
jgi:diacylglycerol kinase (ATP)